MALVALMQPACSHVPATEPRTGDAGEQTEPAAYSSADSLLLLLNTPETFDVLQKHIPFFVNLTEHGIIPPFPTDVTLNDLLQVPEAKVTPENVRAINAELARLGRRN